MLTVDANVWIAAFDPHDGFHGASVAFLRTLAARGIAPCGPAFVVIEVGCALARRAKDPDAGAVAQERLLSHPSLHLHPLDEALLSLARGTGPERLLRGADALYAAVAAALGAPLVSWDQELLERAEATTPEAWLAANP
ncbi:MAG: PIN domain-containing protein [Deltaproteobacteria bacterium]|nr:PIN domain-containing protein [Deltaproteobacteria bacterium]